MQYMKKSFSTVKKNQIFFPSGWKQKLFSEILMALLPNLSFIHTLC